ncbi:hypothetical protein BLNAU_10874 [Blattamonas nauphoetae]|uniref:Uncharacterized protein n=1 Tax=Blattamonas nauphoetae TaxID=2049346 RepID=A0ABQ9XSH8_9EUKA|nr:hypothetical protein BLNAU_10874 [Blattamonas nauphoetae]
MAHTFAQTREDHHESLQSVVSLLVKATLGNHTNSYEALKFIFSLCLHPSEIRRNLLLHTSFPRTLYILMQMKSLGKRFKTVLAENISNILDKGLSREEQRLLIPVCRQIVLFLRPPKSDRASRFLGVIDAVNSKEQPLPLHIPESIKQQPPKENSNKLADLANSLSILSNQLSSYHAFKTMNQKSPDTPKTEQTTNSKHLIDVPRTFESEFGEDDEIFASYVAKSREENSNLSLSRPQLQSHTPHTSAQTSFLMRSLTSSNLQAYNENFVNLFTTSHQASHLFIRSPSLNVLLHSEFSDSTSPSAISTFLLVFIRLAEVGQDERAIYNPKMVAHTFNKCPQATTPDFSPVSSSSPPIIDQLVDRHIFHHLVSLLRRILKFPTFTTPNDPDGYLPPLSYEERVRQHPLPDSLPTPSLSEFSEQAITLLCLITHLVKLIARHGVIDPLFTSFAKRGKLPNLRHLANRLPRRWYRVDDPHDQSLPPRLQNSNELVEVEDRMRRSVYKEGDQTLSRYWLNGWTWMVPDYLLKVASITLDSFETDENSQPHTVPLLALETCRNAAVALAFLLHNQPLVADGTKALHTDDAWDFTDILPVLSVSITHAVADPSPAQVGGSALLNKEGAQHAAEAINSLLEHPINQDILEDNNLPYYINPAFSIVPVTSFASDPDPTPAICDVCFSHHPPPAKKTEAENVKVDVAKPAPKAEQSQPEVTNTKPAPKSKPEQANTNPTPKTSKGGKAKQKQQPKHTPTITTRTTTLPSTMKMKNGSSLPPITVTTITATGTIPSSTNGNFPRPSALKTSATFKVEGKAGSPSVNDLLPQTFEIIRQNLSTRSKASIETGCQAVEALVHTTLDDDQSTESQHNMFDQVMQSGVLKELLAILSSPSKDTLYACSRVLFGLIRLGSSEQKHVLSTLGGITAIINIIRAPDDSIILPGLYALQALLISSSMRQDAMALASVRAGQSEMSVALQPHPYAEIVEAADGFTVLWRLYGKEEAINAWVTQTFSSLKTKNAKGKKKSGKKTKKGAEKDDPVKPASFSYNSVFAAVNLAYCLRGKPIPESRQSIVSFLFINALASTTEDMSEMNLNALRQMATCQKNKELFLNPQCLTVLNILVSTGTDIVVLESFDVIEFLLLGMAKARRISFARTDVFQSIKQHTTAKLMDIRKKAIKLVHDVQS